MSVFDTIAKTIMKIFNRKESSNVKLSAEQIETLLRYQNAALNDIINLTTMISASDMNKLYKKYLTIPFEANNKNNVNTIIPSLYKKYQGKALVAENTQVFGASILACKNMKKITDEILKNFEKYIPDEGLQIQETKVSTVILLGIVEESRVLTNYFSYLWSHFVSAISGSNLTPTPYQVKYLTSNYERFINLVNHICNKDSNYSFDKLVSELKKKQADMVLYQEGHTFLNVVNKSVFTGIDEERMVHGLAIFNIVSHIATYIDIFLHNEYLKKKAMKEKLESELALLRYDLMGVDPNSSEYKILVKRIKMYEDQIAMYDKKIKDYEEDVD